MDRQQLVKEVSRIILKYIQPERIYLYGSEQNGEATATSDIDIAFSGQKSDDLEPIFADVKALPSLLKVDIVNLAWCEERFANRVKDTGRVLYSANKQLRFEDGLYNYIRAFLRFEKVVEGREQFVADGYGDIYLDLAVKRFEFTFEMSWKALKRYLDYTGIVCKNPRSCFQEAYAQGLLENETVWLNMIEMRNSSSHIYNEQEIRGILDKLKECSAAFGQLKERLEEQLSE
ncbi:MAG: HI0074 family nucleotidyltransferase substrate-binding subunit [Desulfuromonadaceae bacterium]|nr:HI0074 family nucleotidyltransferase substrate-binding subunit [Desulfuromonas sp.]MDY0185554.1 HI0074 family nucleotidyltransferase substrate-binding subunit [Desulfuromonadaceae bacterium]